MWAHSCTDAFAACVDAFTSASCVIECMQGPANNSPMKLEEGDASAPDDGSTMKRSALIDRLQQAEAKVRDLQKENSRLLSVSDDPSSSKSGYSSKQASEGIRVR